MSILDTLNVKVVGEGAEIVVLSHGFGSDQSAWQFVVPHLMENYRVVTFDLMGAGSTDPELFNAERYKDLGNYAEDMLAILDALEIKSCVLIGHSMSAMIGFMASVAKPDLFTKIITIGASPRYLNAPGYVGGFEANDLEQLFEAMRSNYSAWVHGFAPLAVDGDIESVAVQEFSRTFFNIRPDIALSVCRSVFTSDLRSILPRVTVPVHVLQGTRDLAVPIPVAVYISQNLGSPSCLEILPVGGHLPHLSAPEVLVPTLVRHLSITI